VSGVDAVLHLAALIPPGSDEDPQRAHEVNVEGTQNVVAACRAQESCYSLNGDAPRSRDPLAFRPNNNGTGDQDRTTTEDMRWRVSFSDSLASAAWEARWRRGCSMPDTRFASTTSNRRPPPNWSRAARELRILARSRATAQEKAREELRLGLMLREGLLKENIDGEALQWALLRSSRSGRSAWQFARDYAGRAGRKGRKS